MIKKFASIRFAIAMLLMGILFTGVSALLMFQDNSNYVETTAEILDIDATYNYSSESYEYEVTLKYKDVDGNDHIAITNGYSASWDVGDSIEIGYNPEDFNDINIPGLEFVIYILFVVGIGAVIYGIYNIIKGAKISNDDNDYNKVDMSKVTDVEIENIKNSTSELNEYYCHYAYKMNQGYVLETTNREPLFEAIPTHIGVFSKNKFNFVNNITHYEEEKEVSHTVNQRYGSGDRRHTVYITTDSHFKINGVNCWKVLGDLGYSLDPHIDLANRKFTYEVKKYGVSVATLEAAGTNIATGKDYKLGRVPAQGIFKVYCKEEDIEGIFMACFILFKTELHYQ